MDQPLLRPATNGRGARASARRSIRHSFGCRAPSRATSGSRRKTSKRRMRTRASWSAPESCRPTRLRQSSPRRCRWGRATRTCTRLSRVSSPSGSVRSAGSSAPPLDAAIEHALARTARPIPRRCALPGPALGHHPCPLCPALRRWGSGRAARCAGRHWSQGLGRAAEVSWLSTGRRRGIARRWSPPQWRLTGSFRGDHQEPELAELRLIVGGRGSTRSPRRGLSDAAATGRPLRRSRGTQKRTRWSSS